MIIFLCHCNSTAPDRLPPSGQPSVENQGFPAALFLDFTLLAHSMWLLPLVLRSSNPQNSKEVKEKQGTAPKRLVSLTLGLRVYLILSEEKMGKN